MDQVDEYYLDRVVDVAETALVETTEDIVSGCGINLTAKGPASWPRQVDITHIVRTSRRGHNGTASAASELIPALGRRQHAKHGQTLGAPVRPFATSREQTYAHQRPLTDVTQSVAAGA